VPVLANDAADASTTVTSVTQPSAGSVTIAAPLAPPVAPELTVTVDQSAKSISIDGHDLLPGGSWNLEVHSTAMTVATGSVVSTGVVHLVVSIPSSLEPGAHTLIATGIGADGSTVVSTTQFTVPAEAPLAFTGADAQPWFIVGDVLLALGGALLLGTLLVRRRRQTR
jgi:hypothetical protein